MGNARVGSNPAGRENFLTDEAEASAFLKPTFSVRRERFFDS